MQRHVYAVKNCMSRIWRRGSEPCRSVVIILARIFSEDGWEPRLVEEREAQPDGAHAGGATAARASWLREPVLILLETARSVLGLYKYQRRK